MRGTIASSVEISRLFKEGKKVNTASILALVAEKKGTTAEDETRQRGRMAVVAGKRLGNAPQRNKAKRRIREAARLTKAPWQGYDVIFVAKEKIFQADFDKVKNDMERIANAVKSISSKEDYKEKQ